MQVLNLAVTHMKRITVHGGSFFTRTPDVQAQRHCASSQQLKIPVNSFLPTAKNIFTKTADAQDPSSKRISKAKQLMRELTAGLNAA
jgi:hypothetical protein